MTDQVSTLSCYSCKRFVISESLVEVRKCANGCLETIGERLNVCGKSDRACEYPSSQLKPGPKPGGRRSEANVNAISASVTSPTSRAAQQLASPSSSRDVATADAAGNDPAAAAFSYFTYPSHEERTRPATPIVRSDNAEAQSSHIHILDGLCNRLQISRAFCDQLLRSYFSNMTAFSLFTEEILEIKLASAKRLLDVEALLASMFSFSARFLETSSVQKYSYSHFADLTSKKISQALDEYGDASPSLCLLQACTLQSFYELTRSVRSRAWRVLGQCIRIAYELQLHLVDETPMAMEDDDIDVEDWAHREEKRRAWWAIWEMDVFASTIRRLPTSIDWSQNLTLLPVSDRYWASKSYQKSSFLLPDPQARWKTLAESGNRSGRAWFILINSLMRNTQLLVYSPSPAQLDRTADDREVDLLTLANALYCTVSSLPEELAYHGEVLTFQKSDSIHDDTPIQRDCDKYSLHLMTQLGQFMINHHRVRAQAPWLNERGQATYQSLDHQAANAEWLKYMNAADEIVTVVRNSSVHHYRYVNPFLVNTLWFAAAAQCSCRVLGPPSLVKYRRLADSNLELLRLTIDHFIEFWGSTERLKDKLARMENGLKTLMEQRGSGQTTGQERRQLQQAAALTEEHGPNSEATYLDLNDNALLDSSTAGGWTSILAPANDIFDSAFGGLDSFPYGLDDLLISYDSSILNMDL